MQSHCCTTIRKITRGCKRFVHSPTRNIYLSDATLLGIQRTTWRTEELWRSTADRSDRDPQPVRTFQAFTSELHVPGRTKTDVLDCRWIQKLHSFGLLSGSFRPDQQIRKLRTLMRLRDNLIVASTLAFITCKRRSSTPILEFRPDLL
jgi:hypothetical protein